MQSKINHKEAKNLNVLLSRKQVKLKQLNQLNQLNQKGNLWILSKLLILKFNNLIQSLLLVSTNYQMGLCAHQIRSASNHLNLSN